MVNAQEFVNLFMEKLKEFPHLRNHSHEVTGLFKGEAGILIWLYHNMCFHGEEDITPSALSRMIGFSRPAITSLLNSLEEKGYIIRQMSQRDRRRQRVSLTEKGRRFAENKFQYMNERLQFLFEHLGEEKTKMLLGLLQESLDILTTYSDNSTVDSDKL